MVIKLVRRPVPQADLPPFASVASAALKLQDLAHAPTGRVVGRRQLADSSGHSELFYADPGDAEARRLPLAPVNFRCACLSLDGDRVLVNRAADGEAGVAQVWIAQGKVETVWRGGAPAHASYTNVLQALYAAHDQVVFVTGSRLVLLRWEAGQLALAQALEGTEGSFAGEVFSGGRFLVLTHPSKSFLIAVKPGELVLVRKAPKKKEIFEARGDRLFAHEPEHATWHEIDLEALAASA